MSTPRVSIVLSVYNGDRHLAASLDSLLSQTFNDWEIIAVNDGSADRSLEILRSYERADSRIRVIDQSNTGLTRALINGCSQARGTFIARQDADDWSHPQRLEKQLQLIQSAPDVTMVSCWADYVDDSGEMVERVKRPTNPDEATYELLYDRKGPPAHGTMLFRRSDYETVGGYRSCFHYSQDSDLWLRLAERGSIAYVGEVLYRARISPNGISSVRSDWQLQFGELGRMASEARRSGRSDSKIIELANELCRQLAAHKQQPHDASRLQSAACYRIGTMLSRQRNQRAREYFWSAVRRNPWHWRSWCRLGWELFRGGKAAKPT